MPTEKDQKIDISENGENVSGSQGGKVYVKHEFTPDTTTWYFFKLNQGFKPD